jgi:chromosome segregation ATPase
MSTGDITGPFFDRLDEMLGGGKKLSELRTFLAPYREQFEALERDSKAKNGKGKNKTLEAALADSETENKRRDEIISELRQELANTGFSNASLKKGEAAYIATEAALEDANKEVMRLREEVAHLKGQITARDERIEILNADIQRLMKTIGERCEDIESFEEQVETLRKEIAVLEEAAKGTEAEQEKAAELPDDAMKVLLKVAQAPGQKIWNLSQIAETEWEWEALHYLQRLQSAGMISHRLYHDDTQSWEPTKEGLELLIGYIPF